ncbi:DUF481 domain-containing protein [Flammeovirgaceae bacterium SG7u.111]|nr:DUF481 domain-containing protein [Flammeovirgaceae bacterium SG7u.132]WPO33927.1 DUF481 domain-containing protein [Flammeovirgaceae bacterium SG7u.111]
MSKPNLCLFFFLMISPNFSFAQTTDSLYLTNGDMIVGEIKGMDRGVLTIETDYSDSDFKIEWDGISTIFSNSFFLIILSEGKRLNGNLKSVSAEKILIFTSDSSVVDAQKEDIVFLKEIEKGFWDRLYASIDFGLSITKANNLRQLSLRSNAGYIADKWSADANFNSVNSSQDDVEPIRRTDGGLTYRYFLPKDWFVIGQVNFLSNTEQKIDLRTTGKLGIGNYLVHTNQSYWAFQGGASFNNEKFSNEGSDKQSMEAFLGTELNLFDIGNLSLLTNGTVYPSITEKGRWRADLNFDAKYDLPLDFYIKLGVSYNYDNQPAENSSTDDYVFQTTFGWSL